MASVAVGIDLGTTNSVVAIAQGGRPRVLNGPDGSPLIPSIVSFHPNGSTLVGSSARARRPIDPANTIFSVKRLLGRPFHSEEVRRASARFAFELREGPDSAILVRSRAGDLSLPEVSALVLREIRRVAETALGETVDRAIVTVPANFNELQRTATKVAGRIADLDVIRILNEPTAASLAYGYGRGTRERIAVYDFGGGTFDVTLLELSGNVFEVLATAGDTFLGGDDVDLLITESLADALLRSQGVNALEDRRAYELLRAAAEQAKIELSAGDVANIRIPEIGYAAGGTALEFRSRITRPELERLATPLIARTFDVCNEALKLASLRPQDFQSVILVGGSTRMPAVQTRVAAFFGRDPLMTLPPETVVGLGAAVLAEALAGGPKRARPATTQAPVNARPPPSAGATGPGPRAQPRGPTAEIDGATARGARTGNTREMADSGGTATPGGPAEPAPPAPPAKRGNTLDIEPRVATAPHGSVAKAPPAGDPRLPTPTSPFQAASISASVRGRTVAPGALAGELLPPPKPTDLSWDSGPKSQRPIDALDEPDVPITAAGTAPLDADFGGESTKNYPPMYRPPSGRPVPPSSPLEARRGAPGMRAPSVPPQGLPGPRTPAGVNQRPSNPPRPGDDEPEQTGVFRPANAGAIFGSAAPGVPPSGAGGGLPGLLGPPGAVPTVGPRTSPLPRPPPPEPGARVVTQRHVNSNAITTPAMSAVSPPTPPATGMRAPTAPPLPPAAPPTPTLRGPIVPAATPPPATSTLRAPVVPPAAPPPSPTAPPAPNPAYMQTLMAPMSSFGAAGLPDAPSLPPTPLAASAQDDLPLPPPPAPSPSGPKLSESFLGFKAVQQPAPAPAASPSFMAALSGVDPGRTVVSNPATPNATQVALPPPLLLDVTPHSLGLETLGGLCEVIIPRNATIPVEQTREFATSYDAQDAVRIRISQGESRRFTENQGLGELELSGISRAPRGEVKIAVTFELDADGTLQVRAREVGTGRQTTTQVNLLTMPSASAEAGMAQRQRG